MFLNDQNSSQVSYTGLSNPLSTLFDLFLCFANLFDPAFSIILEKLGINQKSFLVLFYFKKYLLLIL